MRVKSLLLTAILATAVMATWSCQDRGPVGLEEHTLDLAKKGGGRGGPGGITEPVFAVITGGMLTPGEQEMGKGSQDSDKLLHIIIGSSGTIAMNLNQTALFANLENNDPGNDDECLFIPSGPPPEFAADLIAALVTKDPEQRDPHLFSVRVDLARLGGEAPKNRIFARLEDTAERRLDVVIREPVTRAVKRLGWGNPTVEKNPPPPPPSCAPGETCIYRFVGGTGVVQVALTLLNGDRFDLYCRFPAGDDVTIAVRDS
jgi:hypothetical protein